MSVIESILEKKRALRPFFKSFRGEARRVEI